MASAMAVTAVTADSAVWAASAMAASAVWVASAMAVSAVSVATAMVDTAALVASVASAASAISVSTEYCEVNESRDTSLTSFQRLSAQLFQPYAIRPHTFLFLSHPLPPPTFHCQHHHLSLSQLLICLSASRR